MPYKPWYAWCLGDSGESACTCYWRLFWVRLEGMMEVFGEGKLNELVRLGGVILRQGGVWWVERDKEKTEFRLGRCFGNFQSFRWWTTIYFMQRQLVMGLDLNYYLIKHPVTNEKGLITDSIRTLFFPSFFPNSNPLPQKKSRANVRKSSCICSAPIRLLIAQYEFNLLPYDFICVAHRREWAWRGKGLYQESLENANPHHRHHYLRIH